MIQNRNVVVWHQILSITNIDFANEIIYGYTELTLIPLKDEINLINLNCKQCKIFSIVLNGTVEAEFEYCDPLAIKLDETRRDLQTFLSNEELASISVDADEGNGELSITIPTEFKEQIKKNQPIMLAVEFCLEKPKGGVRFMSKKPLVTSSSMEHVYLCSVDHNAHYWFPCVNSYNEPCTWKIEVIVEDNFTVIASGNLVEIETVTSADGVNDLNAQKPLKKFNFFLQQPTCACNIGLVVGQFDSFNDDNMPEISYFCDPKLNSLIKNTTTFIHELFDYYEDVFSVQYPFAVYKQVYVADILEDFLSFSSLSIVNINILHPDTILDQALVARRILANTIAQQYFLCFVTMNNLHEWWLNIGLCNFFAGLYIKKLMGNNEYKFMMYQNLKEVCTYEKEQGPVVLDFNFNQANLRETNVKPQFSLRHHLIGCPKFFRIVEKKAHLVVRLIDDNIGRETMFQVANRILNNAMSAVEITEYADKCRSVFYLSIESFMDCLSVVNGNKDIRHLLDLWVYKPGVARFNCMFNFNRKKNTIEIEIKQDMVNQKGYRKYVGPITLTVQETEGSFTHTIQIEDNLSSKFDIQCHSKGKRNKKKKIPLITGEEVDIDLSHTDTDSPIIWMRLDSDLKILREIRFDQPDYNWQNQLRYEKDICAQLDSADMLTKFNNATTRTALISVLENSECFYQVRIRAAYVLAEVSNKMIHSWNGPLPLIPTFRKLFMSPACPNIVSSNNFNDLQLYFIQKNVPIAMGHLRNTHNVCPSECIRFLLDLIKFNENTKNPYSDCYYRAALIDSLASTVSTSLACLQSDTFGGTKSANLSQDMRLVVEEILLRMNLEKILPTYRYVITCSCLKAIRNLQKLGHIPDDIDKFKEYAEYRRNFEDVRLVAFEIIIEYLSVKNDQELLDYLLTFVEFDPSFKIKQHIVQLLCRNPPFKFNSDETPLNNENLVNKLWRLMNEFNYNNSLKAGIADLYYILYGNNKPKCLRHSTKQTIKIGSNIEQVALIIEN